MDKINNYELRFIWLFSWNKALCIIIEHDTELYLVIFLLRKVTIDFVDHLQYLSDVKKYTVLDIHSFSGTDENSSEVSKCFPSCGYNLQHSNQFLGVTI